MALAVGSRLGHYDITAKLGEGGMGEVWQATDTKLNRQVALKILPEAFASDPDRLARFQREAQVLASLNHPGIAAIYGIEEADDTRALVLELVEGPTLADRVAQGPVPVDEALPIAKQIAEALQAAHEAGVIHRDLKPANIKVRDDGTVKVLDFGLAKTLDTTPEGDPSQSPTWTALATATGVIMGTAAYMAPEQAKGKVADGRADVWAFGCVLCEMLTGRRAFAGDTVSETLASVLTREPALDALPSGWPASGRRLLRRCFEREPRRRLRDVSEGLLLVEEDLARSDEAEPVVSAAPPQVAVVRHALPDGQTLLVGVNPGGGLDLHTLAFGQDTQTEPLLAESDYREYMPHVSPNGRWLAYTSDESGRSEVYVRPFPDVEAGRKWTITGDGGGAPVWSDDGTKLFFQQPTSREMFVVSVETDGPVFTPGIPDVLFDGPYLYASRVEARNRAWDIAHDGRFLMIKENASGDIVVVLNWLQELEERVPVD